MPDLKDELAALRIEREPDAPALDAGSSGWCPAALSGAGYGPGADDMGAAGRSMLPPSPNAPRAPRQPVERVRT